MAFITTVRDQGTYGAVDAGIYAGSFMLAAESLGIATVAQAALASMAPTIREHLAIPIDRMMLLGISFGYPDPDHPANSFRTTRAPLSEVVTWVDH